MYRELQERLKRIQAIEQPIPYTGENNLADINQYLDQIYQKLSNVIFEGADVRPDDEKWQKAKEQFGEAFREHNKDIMESLTLGGIYPFVGYNLIKQRLKKEVGERYHNDSLGIDAKIVFDETLPQFVTCTRNDPGGEPEIHFSELAVMLMNSGTKKKLLDHEAIQIALGHLDGPLPDDRRKLKFDADYLTALSHNDAEGFAKALSFVLPFEKMQNNTTIDELIGREKQKIYQLRGKKPGEDAELDEAVANFTEIINQKASFSSQVVYPKTEGRIEELSAMSPRLSHWDNFLKGAGLNEEEIQQSHQDRLRDEIEARRFNRNAKR